MCFFPCFQAEVDELMKRYETVKVENTALKSEINQLTEEVEKLKAENCALMVLLVTVEFSFFVVGLSLLHFLFFFPL